MHHAKSLITLFLASCLWFGHEGYAEEAPRKSARLNMGYYYNSFIDVANRTDIEVSLNFWVKDLFVSEATKHDFTITSSQALIFDRIEDLQYAFRHGEVDLIFAPPLVIAKSFKREELADGFVGVYKGRKPEKLILIARSDQHINEAKDLRGKRLAMVENDELADIFLDSGNFQSSCRLDV
jgi:phosphonate transport system substrate-binding protein